MRNPQMKQNNPSRKNELTAGLLILWSAVLLIFFSALYLDDGLSGSAMYNEVLIAAAVLMILAVIITIVFLTIYRRTKDMEKKISRPGTYLMATEAAEEKEEEITGKNVN